ncbi:MAG: VWA domain-containing protein [Acidobacteria bacterium]|nr:VWA domain-containing protein [Acidobacteriota bacterium]
MRTLHRIFAVFTALALAGQQPAQNPNQEPIRITVNLVQVDAVVTDSKGKLVPNLKAEDFEILQDGKSQKIRSFSFIRTESAAPPPPIAPTKKGQPAAPPPPPRNVAIKPNQVRRTIAIVVDDLNLSWESMAFSQQSLKKFINDKVQPGDLVAIIRTGAGIGALQSFTANKREMLAAAERVKWNPMGRGRISPFSEPQEGDEAFAQMDDFRDRLYSVGTLGAINYVITGLRELPGRKSVVLLSEGLNIFNREGATDQVLDNMQRLTDLANRSSVVIYAIDARGLPTLNIGASERGPSSTNPTALAERQARRSQEYFDSQNGLNYLAEETGGIFYRDSNDIAGSLGKVLEDQEGYYLLGYSPTEETFNRKFHKISVRIKRPGLKIRSRHGFLGVPDRDARPTRRTRQEQMVAALTSPFGTTGVPLRLTTLFSHNATQGAFITSLLHIDMKNVKFEDEEDGWKKARLDILIMTFGENGIPVDQTDKTFTVRLKGPTLKQATENGLVYTIHHPIKKAGAYQLRTVVRDATSEVAGSASQFIDVPDVAKGRLAMSGLYLKTSRPAAPAAAAPNPAAPAPPASGGNETQPAEGQQRQDDPKANPVMRTFHSGQQMVYYFQVLNAKMNDQKKADLEVQARIFRDGQKIFEGRQLPFTPASTDNGVHYLAGGQLRLGSDLKPGDYVLQVSVLDKLGKPKQNATTQFIDFTMEPGSAAPTQPKPAAPKP